MTIKQLLIILSCGLVLFLFIFNQDSKTSSVSQDANEVNIKLKQKNLQPNIEVNRKRDVTRSKVQELSQKQETTKIVNREVSSLNRVNDK